MTPFRFNPVKVLVCMAACLPVFCAVPTTAIVLHVPEGYSTIQAALNAAQSGDTVAVAAGLYAESLTWPSRNRIMLSGAGMDSTIVVGTQVYNNINFTSAAVDTDTVVRHVQFRRGYFGVYVNGSSPKLDQCIIEGAHQAGLIFYGTSNAVVSDCLVRGNGWAGIQVECTGQITVRGNLIAANTCGTGGGVVGYAGTALIRNNTFVGNTAPGGGSAVSFPGGAGVVTGNTFVDNSGGPGTIRVLTGSEVSIQRNAFARNAGQSGGLGCGGIYLGVSSTPVSACNFQDNGFALVRDSGEADDSGNWWGHESGPWHPTLNPSGLGDSTNVTGFSPWLASEDILAPPLPPVGVYIFADTYEDGDPGVAWSAAPLADLGGYRVHYDVDGPGFPYANTIDVGDTTRHVLRGLAPGVVHYIAITCYDVEGHGSWYSREVTVVPPASAIDESDGQSDPSIVSVPNPCTSGTTIVYSGEATGPVSVEVLDLNGRCMMTMRGIPRQGGIRSVVWDGRDFRGREAPGGCYFVRIAFEDGSSHRSRITVVR